MTKTRRIGLAGAGVLAALLAYAWINGGAQALRPIEQPVELPEVQP